MRNRISQSRVSATDETRKEHGARQIIQNPCLFRVSSVAKSRLQFHAAPGGFVVSVNRQTDEDRGEAAHVQFVSLQELHGGDPFLGLVVLDWIRPRLEKLPPAPDLASAAEKRNEPL